VFIPGNIDREIQRLKVWEMIMEKGYLDID
jgi:hypothetical protein